MKVVTKEKKSYYDVYEAFDGTEFTELEDCRKYEEQVESVFAKRFYSFSRKIKNGDTYYAIDNLLDDSRGEAKYFIATPTTDSDINAMIAFIENNEGSLSDYGASVSKIEIGKKYLVAVSDYWASVSTMESIKALFDKLLTRTEKAFTEEDESEPALK